jgi:hypothetical protein
MPLTFQAISFGCTITMARRRSQFSPRTAGPTERCRAERAIGTNVDRDPDALLGVMKRLVEAKGARRG